MKKLKILKMVLKRTKTDKIIISFVIFYLIDAFLIMLIEPGIRTYGDALWYCYSVFSTVGFGDLTVTTTIGKLLSVCMTLLTLLIVALVTGVVVAFYVDVVSMQYKASKAEIVDKLERLDELSKEELRDISERIKKLR